jgi:hypothetical protein
MCIITGSSTPVRVVRLSAEFEETLESTPNLWQETMITLQRSAQFEWIISLTFDDRRALG